MNRKSARKPRAPLTEAEVARLRREIAWEIFEDMARMAHRRRVRPVVLRLREMKREEL